MQDSPQWGGIALDAGLTAEERHAQMVGAAVEVVPHIAVYRMSNLGEQGGTLS